MNYWVIAFPCLMYLASVGMCSSPRRPNTPTLSAHVTCTVMGIVFIYETVQPAFVSSHNTTAVNIGLSYFSIAFSLNIILTLMIVIRLIMHSRNSRNALGAPAKAGGLYKVIVTMLVESSALYAVTFLLFIVPWSIKSGVQLIFFPILADAQVRVVSLRFPSTLQP